MNGYIVPYQGWIGLVLLVLSLINFILLLVRIGDMTGTKAMGRTFGGASGMQWVTWVLYLVSSIVGIGLGFLLGYGMINKLLAAAKETSETPAVEPATESEATPDDEAIAQAAAAPEAAPPAAGEPVGEALYLKLQGIQQPLGLAGMALGLLSVIFGIIWFPPSPNFMGVILFLLMLLTGGLAASALVIKKMPDTASIVKCMESSKGSAGLATLVWGLLNLIWTLRLTGMVSDFADMPKSFGGPGGGIWVWWIFSLLASLVAVALGFLLSFALLKRFVLSGEGEAADAAEALRKKLAPIQTLLGLAAMLLGLLHLIFTLVWW